MYYANEVAKRLKINVATLHYYEKVKLSNDIYRDKNNNRRYSEKDLSKIEMIVLMRQVDISIKDIRTYLSLTNDDYTKEEVINFLVDYKEGVSKKIVIEKLWLN